MALKEPFMVKTVVDDNLLELEAKTGESILVKGIRIYNPASNYATISIEKTTVGYFRVGGTLGNHLAFNISQEEFQNDWSTAGNKYRVEKFGLHPNLLDFMIHQGWMKGYPIEEGQTLTITGVKQSGCVQQVIYEVYDAGDIKRTDPNGSESSEYLYLNYIRPSSAINKTGDTIYDTSQTPTEFPSFPAGADVPAKTEITLLGICASPFAPNENDGTDYSLTSYLKLIRERVTLFDDDKNGILLKSLATTVSGSEDLVGAGLSEIGQCSDIDRKLPFVLPTPIVFTAGDELNVYLTTVKGGSGKNIAVDEAEVTFIQAVKRIA